MKKKLIYLTLITLSFSIIYASGTGIYFSCIYQSLSYDLNVDIFSEVYFYLLNTIGILLISLLMKRKYTPNKMIIAFSASLIGTVILSFSLFLPVSKTIFIILLLTIFLLVGCIQGTYVFLITKCFPKSKRCLGIGIGASVSVVLNSTLSIIDNGKFVQTIYAVISYLIAAVLVSILFAFTIKKFPNFGEEQTDANPQSSFTPPSWNKKSFLTACLFIAFSWLIQSLGFYFPFNDGLVTGLSNEVLRITNILGLLISGYLNSRDKKAGSLVCLFILATPMLYIILQNQTGLTLLVFLLSYFFTGFLSIYRIGIIADMSDSVNSKGESMTYMCTFGLIFGRIGEGLGGLMGIKYKDNTMLLLTLTSFFLVIAVAFFIYHYIRLYFPISQVVQTHEDKINSFKVKYNLSTREKDVLELLIDGASNAEIADRLYVSENTVRFHVGNILKKTECKSRKEVSALFFGK